MKRNLLEATSMIKTLASARTILFFRSLLVMVLIGCVDSTYAQRVKYKDLFPTFSALSNDEIKNELKEYLAEDLDHPNANFRLAYVYEMNFKKADPLTDFQYAMANAEQAKIRYIKAKQLVDEREVDRNNEYYFPLFKTFDAKGKPYVSFMQVQQKMNNGYDSAVLFYEKMPAIYKNFTKSVYHYDIASKLFANISSQFNSTEDLLLLSNQEWDTKFGSLKMHYDSTLVYLNRYLELIKANPIPNHQQHYQIQPIKTYRLDGLQTRVNFLVNDISLWDYGTWVDQTRQQLSKAIVDLREKLKQQEDRLDKSLEKVAVIGAGEAFTPVTLDKQTMFALGNFDRQSLLQPLFIYKGFKQEYIRQRKQMQLDTAASERNAQAYTQWIYSNLKADSLLREVKSNIAPLKIEKHKDFLETYYRGKSGIENMVQAEEKAIKEDFQSQTTAMQNVVRKLQVGYAGEPGKLVKITTASVPLFIIPGDSLPTDNSLRTKRLLKNSDGSVYIGGVYRPDKKLNNLMVYVAKISAEGKGEWFKNFNLKADSLSKEAFDNFIGPMTLTKEGCAFVVHTLDVTKTKKLNTLIYLTEKGEDKKRKKLVEMNFPRHITYSESVNGFVILLKGEEPAEKITEKEKVVLLSYNVLGDQLWKRELEFTGNVVQLFNLSDGYALAGNYLQITDLAGKEYRTRVNDQEANSYFIKVKSTGDVALIKPLSVGKSLVTTRVVKINDSSIHLLGSKGTLADVKPEQELNSHIMIDSNGLIIFNNL